MGCCGRVGLLGSGKLLSCQSAWQRVQVDCFSYGVVLWEIITKEQTQRGNWRTVRVPAECPAEVEELLQASAGPAGCPHTVVSVLGVAMPAGAGPQWRFGCSHSHPAISSAGYAVGRGFQAHIRPVLVTSAS